MIWSKIKNLRRLACAEFAHHNPVLSGYVLRLAIGAGMKGGFSSYGFVVIVLSVTLYLAMRPRVVGGKIQSAIRRKSEAMGPVCFDHYLCAHARMVHHHAARCQEVQVVSGIFQSCR
jgi:hypothetical protein